MTQIQFLASGLNEITMQSDKRYKTFEKGLKEGPIACSTSGRWTKSPKSTESQNPNYKEDLKKYADSRLARQSFNSFRLLLSSRIQAKILDLSSVGKGGLLQSSKTM